MVTFSFYDGLNWEEPCKQGELIKCMPSVCYEGPFCVKAILWSGQEFLIGGNTHTPHEHLFHSSLTLLLHPYGYLTVRTRDQILLKVCIPSQSHTLIPFTFLVSDYFISSVQATPLSTQTSQCWNADKSIECWQQKTPASSYYRHTVHVWWHAHWAMQCEKQFFQMKADVWAWTCEIHHAPWHAVSGKGSG